MKEAVIVFLLFSSSFLCVFVCPGGQYANFTLLSQRPPPLPLSYPTEKIENVVLCDRDLLRKLREVNTIRI
jgi:hypothetical protein